MSDAARLFAKIDTNKSGAIDADELLKHLLEAGVDTDEISRAHHHQRNDALPAARCSARTRRTASLARALEARPPDARQKEV